MTDQGKSQIPAHPPISDPAGLLDPDSIRQRRSSMHQAIDAVKAGYQVGDIVVLADKINEYVANGNTGGLAVPRQAPDYPQL